jgi:hypothetical protein
MQAGSVAGTGSRQEVEKFHIVSNQLALPTTLVSATDSSHVKAWCQAGMLMSTMLINQVNHAAQAPQLAFIPYPSSNKCLQHVLIIITITAVISHIAI